MPSPVVSRPRPKLSWSWWLVIAVAIVSWDVVIIPSGLDVSALLVFTAPAAALGLFMRWASCLFTTSRWNWRMATDAALTGAMLLPPFLAALVTLSGMQRPEALLPLFVLGAWLALGGGLLVAAFTPGEKKPVPQSARSHAPRSETQRTADVTRAGELRGGLTTPRFPATPPRA